MINPIPQPETRTQANWRDPATVPETERPEHWAWLIEPASLTARLENALGTIVEVERLSETSDGEGALRREVRLHSGGEPLVYAVSHIPAKLLTRLGWNQGLGDQPLGTRLFSDPGAIREDLRVAHLPEQDPLVQRAHQGLSRSLGPLWARRSRLVIKGQAMVIVECFLREGPR